MRLFILVRHGQSELNVARRVNGDPTVTVALTPQGEAEAEALRLQVANVTLDLCVHTRFERSRQTAEIAVASRDVPLIEEPLLDDIDVGDLEGETIDDYRAWKHSHRRDEAVPERREPRRRCAALRDGFERLLARPEQRILVVCHEIPVRYALNAAAGSDTLDGPAHEIGNCIPHLFDEDGLQRAIAGIHRLTL